MLRRSVFFYELLHDPRLLIDDVMAAPLNHPSRDVCATMSSQSLGHGREIVEERRFTSYCYDQWHIESALLFRIECFVCTKLAVDLKGSMQLFWGCIRRGVASDVGVAEILKIEEVAEVKCLATCHQLFREIGYLLKMNVPGEGFRDDLLPRCESGKRNIENHRSACILWVKADECICHHAANVVTDHIGMLQMELFLKLMNVTRNVRSSIPSRFRGRSANARQVNGYDGKLPRQTRHHLVVLIPVFGKRMQHNHGGARTTANIMKRYSARVDRGGDKTGAQFGHSRIRRLPKSVATSGQDDNGQNLEDSESWGRGGCRAGFHCGILHWGCRCSIRPLANWYKKDGLRLRN